MSWRVGEHYGIHVYEGDRPVATFHQALDAEIAVDSVNRTYVQITEDVVDRCTQALRDANTLQAWREANPSAADTLVPAAAYARAVIASLIEQGIAFVQAPPQLRLPVCEQHYPVQHRDGKPPWCASCGLTAEFEVPEGRLQAVRERCPKHNIPDCSVLLNGCSWRPGT